MASDLTKPYALDPRVDFSMKLWDGIPVVQKRVQQAKSCEFLHISDSYSFRYSQVNLIKLYSYTTLFIRHLNT